MVLKILATLAVTVMSLTAIAQTAAQKKGLKTANIFIQGYNEQDYSKVRSRYSLLFKMLLSKKKIKQWMVPKYATYGKIISGPGDIKATNRNVTMTLKYANDPGKVENVGFYLTKTGKIIGMHVKSDNFIFIPPAQPVASAESEVDSILNKAFPGGFNGAVMYVSDDKTVYRKNYGFADLDARLPLNDSSVFELASCSKQFTAAAILKLQEMGKLSVEDSLSKFFPQLPYPGIQIKHLVWHTSGLPDYMSPLMKKKVDKTYCFNEDIITMLASGKYKKRFQPGERHEYSNTGYAVLASVIEKASGQSYAAFLDQHFFAPLQMTHTRVYNTRRTKGEVINNYAYGYVYNSKDKKYYLPDSIKGEKEFVTKLDGIVGDGTVNTTILDLVKWDRALRNYTILNKTSVDSAYAPGTTNAGKKLEYGYGVGVNTKDNTGKIISHTGSWPGYTTLIYRFPEKKQMLVILCNKEHPQNNIQLAARKITSLFIGSKELLSNAR